MLNIRGISVFTLLFFFSCNEVSKTEELNLTLDRDSLINILVDLEIADQAARTYPRNKRDSVKNVFIDQVLEIHKVDSLQMSKEFLALQTNKRGYLKIQEEVAAKLDSLSKKIK